MTFGEHARALREAAGIGLRELARAIEKSPTLISRVETGQETEVSEKTLMAWAKALGTDPVLFLARAGRLPPDVVDAISDNPGPFIELVRQLRAVPRRQQAKVAETLIRQVKDGDW